MSLPIRSTWNRSSEDCATKNPADKLDPEVVALWSILEQGSDGICLLAVETSGSGLTGETNFRFIAANRAAKEMLICRTPEVKGLLLRECLPKAIAGQLWVHLYHGVQTREPVEGELWVEKVSHPIRSQPGYSKGSSVQKLKAKILKLSTPDKPNLVICLLQQPQNQEAQVEARLLATITQDIAAAKDFHTCIATAMERVCEATDWDYGEVWLPSADGGHLRCIAASYRGENPILENFKNKILSWTFLPNQGIPGRVWVSKQPEWHQDVSQLSPEIFHRAELAKTAGIKAALAVPILEGEQVLAVLVFFKSSLRNPVSQTRNLSVETGFLEEVSHLLTGTSFEKPGFCDASETRFLNRVVDIVLAISTQLGALIKLKKVEAALREAEQKYRSIFENSVEGIFQTTPDGRYLNANPMLARIYGYATPEALMAELQDIQHQLYVEPSRRAQFQQLLQETDAVWGFESQIYQKDGTKIWISENARAIKDSNGALLCYEGTVVDITQRKVAEAQLQRRDSLLQGVAEAMNYLLVEQRSYEAVKKALATLGAAAGVERVYVCAKKPHQDGYVGDLEMQFEWRAGVSGEGSSSRTTMFLEPETGAKSGVTLNHRLYSALVKGSPVIFRREQAEKRFQESYREDLSVLMVPMMVNGSLMGYVGFEARNLSADFCATIEPTETLLATESEAEELSMEISSTGGYSASGWSKSEESILGAIANSIGAALDRYHQEQAIRHQAYHDALTGLPNRQQLEECLPPALENARATGEKVAVMFLDLDRFKLVNDSLGHAIGDRLLQEAAHRLRRSLRDKDTIVRWGGDEFIIILEGILTHEDATHIANRILEVLRPALMIEGHELYISGSLGIALYPDDGKDAQTLMKNADLALYRVKEKGRDNYQLYTAVMSLQPSELLTLTSELHMALEGQEFSVSHQPQINVDTGEITGMEAQLH
ncbi:diguanylate cyclase domain-containing protein [[Phormidium] sp. ETS-05]|uniref:diguanylate cyclase domain-containing protein n=1 Tax=[Phormidium] sp. ETS-05 TaxID=222819 RepID=UPI0018EF2F2E|nr:diguanylate cyclase [[Phormidium] sp. ETS-05]